MRVLPGTSLHSDRPRLETKLFPGVSPTDADIHFILSPGPRMAAPGGPTGCALQRALLHPDFCSRLRPGPRRVPAGLAGMAACWLLLALWGRQAAQEVAVS